MQAALVMGSYISKLFVYVAISCTVLHEGTTMDERRFLGLEPLHNSHHPLAFTAPERLVASSYHSRYSCC